MLEKVKEIYDRYTALTERLSEPGILADLGEWTRLSKERAKLEEIAEKYKQYVSAERERSAETGGFPAKFLRMVRYFMIK